MSQDTGIRIRSLRKRYGRVEALAGVDFEVPRGSVTLLVGPNGAGKTTLLKVLMDLMPFEEGVVEVLGLDPRADGPGIRAATGFLPEEIQMPFERLRVSEILALNARFRPRWDEAYAAELAHLLDLRMDRPWKKLSKGESRRVQLACALAPRPPLLLLDEPTDGLDPLARETVLGLLAEHLAETGATAIYCTHVLHEAQALADRLVVLARGRVRLDEEAAALRATHRRVRVSVRDALPPPPPFLIREETGGRPERSWVVRADDAEVREWAASAGAEVIEISPVSLGDTALAYLAGGPSPPAAPRPASGSGATTSIEEAHHV